MERENLKSYLTGISHSVASEMAVYSHTLASSLSKPRSSLEAGKKQPRVRLERGCSMNKVFFCIPLVAQSELGEDYECRVLTNMSENDYEVGFVASRTYVHRPMSQCLLWPFNITIGSIVYKFIIQLSLN